MIFSLDEKLKDLFKNYEIRCFNIVTPQKNIYYYYGIYGENGMICKIYESNGEQRIIWVNPINNFSISQIFSFMKMKAFW